MEKPAFPKPGLKKSKADKKRKRPKQLTKDQRMEIYKKYDGRCAYCGKGLDYGEMEVDHLVPVRNFSDPNDANFDDNLMPACRRCNGYKRATKLGYFRMLLTTIHQRVMNDYLVKVARDYGVIEFHPFDGVFYFEKVKKGEQYADKARNQLPGKVE
jgi:hypothetical protein